MKGMGPRFEFILLKISEPKQLAKAKLFLELRCSASSQPFTDAESILYVDLCFPLPSCFNTVQVEATQVSIPGCDTMMNGFPAKSAVIAALLVVLLLMGAFPAASASIPVGGKEYGSVRTLSRREGCFGNRCQRMDLFYNKGSQNLDLSLRRLRQSRHQPPPAPSRNGFHIWSVPPAPPPPAQFHP